ILLPGGREIVTLRDAGDYITSLPKTEQDLEEWQAAVEALLLVVDRYWREIAIAGLIVLGPI
ncbi:MAG TPA: hypothetical protein VEM96_09290, partial [Pyrinomonadaceae bacterium]|nr:hypothetical protein [Pyrinomonadaceae bacterium]